eukprot:GHVP01010527.1.p1 GENE.GHVP01010527.1~~GHVP01010527.1.p1  ORF type:complete len:180 (-),score=32.96 GHVP01010527.1:1074-1613(-)
MFDDLFSQQIIFLTPQQSDDSIIKTFPFNRIAEIKAQIEYTIGKDAWIEVQKTINITQQVNISSMKQGKLKKSLLMVLSSKKLPNGALMIKFCDDSGYIDGTMSPGAWTKLAIEWSQTQDEENTYLDTDSSKETFSESILKAPTVISIKDSTVLFFNETKHLIITERNLDGLYILKSFN